MASRLRAAINERQISEQEILTLILDRNGTKHTVAQFTLYELLSLLNQMEPPIRGHL